MKPRLTFLMAASCAALACSFANAADTPLVNHGDIWHYRLGTNTAQADWKTAPDASLDGTWLTGPGGIGYGDGDDATDIRLTMSNKCTTVYIRRAFVIGAPVDTSLHLKLTMDYDDGFVAYLDGVEITRGNTTNGPGTTVLFNATATSHEASAGAGGNAPSFYDLGAISNRLDVGTHVLAIHGINQTINSSDLSLIADLFYGPLSCPPNTICSDTNWTLANSPYTISSSLTIAAGATLTIDPGVTVQLGSGANLIIANSGRLLAEGTANAPILFTRNGASGSWGNVTINGAVGSPETRIAYAHFEFNGGSPCLEVAAGTVFFDHLTFGNTAASYIHVDGASFVIQDCVFPSATAQFELVHGVQGIKSGGHGIFLRNFFGVPIGYNDVVDFTGGNRPGPIIHFINNVFTGATDDELDLDGTDAWVEGNIFLHAHKNGAPDTSSGVSGGDDSGRTSEITVIGNLFYDCDQAAMGKAGNFYTLINNTIVHQTHAGGTDTDGAVIAVADTDFGPAAGMYVEGNIIYDAEKLLRYYTNQVVTFTNNLMPFAWPGPGGNNSTNDPMLSHIPQLSETVFTNWAQAQIMRTWFSLLPGSPAIGTGPNGRDKGGVIPLGASISGEPPTITTESNATLVVGIVRTGNGIPVSGWPEGSGFTHYKWRLDTNEWSAETPIATPITLAELAPGSHYVEVSGKLDSGLYQDDPLFGVASVVTRSRAWTVGNALHIDTISFNGSTVEIQFIGQEGHGYTIYYRDSLTSGAWQALGHLDPPPSTQTITFPDSPPPGTTMRFYQISSP
jgi:hypothetical protein